MEIAPDFFDYFEAAAKLLDSDKYVTLLFFLLANLRNPIYSLSNYFSFIVALLALKDNYGCFFLERQWAKTVC
jgi:hypothetical protein